MPRTAVDHDNEAGFLAVEEFLDHHARAGVAKGVAREHVAYRLLGFGQRHGDDHALARGQAIGLDDDRCTAFTQIGECGFDFGEVLVGRGGDVVACEEVLGESLGAFQLGGSRGGAEDRQATTAEQVDYAFDQRCLGADDGELDIGRGEIGQLLDGQHVDGDILALGFQRRAGVARGDENLFDAGILRHLPGQGVLAATAADDQYVHCILLRESGPWPDRWTATAVHPTKAVALAKSIRAAMASGRCQARRASLKRSCRLAMSMSEVVRNNPGACFSAAMPP